MKQASKYKTYNNKIRALNKFCFSHDSECTGCKYTNVVDLKGCCLLENRVQKLMDKLA